MSLDMVTTMFIATCVLTVVCVVIAFAVTFLWMLASDTVKSYLDRRRKYRWERDVKPRVMFNRNVVRRQFNDSWADGSALGDNDDRWPV